MFITGCTSTFPTFSKVPASQESHSGADQFNAALKKLEKKDDPSNLKKISESDPQSIWSERAHSILKTYSAQQEKISRLNNKNRELIEENTKLKDNIDKLNRINLEMEKRSP